MENTNRIYKTNRDRYFFEDMQIGGKIDVIVADGKELHRVRSAAHMVGQYKGWKFSTSSKHIYDNGLMLTIKRVL